MTTLYLSGIGVLDAAPEVVLESRANVMFSFHRCYREKKSPGKPRFALDERFANVWEAGKVGAAAAESIHESSERRQFGSHRFPAGHYQGALGTYDVRKEDGREWTVHRPASHFLDSGAFSLWRAQGAKDYSFYDSPQFIDYCRDYAAFLQEYSLVIDFAANLDVVPTSAGKVDPNRGKEAARLSLRNWKKLRKLGCPTVPVIHYGVSFKRWLPQYLDEGDPLVYTIDEGGNYHPYVALGGLVGSINKPGAREWVDGCFDLAEKRGVHLHGFGLSNQRALIRWPWHSADSSSWDRFSSYGRILVPPTVKGVWSFEEPWLVVATSDQQPSVKDGSGMHYWSLSEAERRHVDEWLEEVEVPFGDVKEEKSGVVNWQYWRRVANLRYFGELQTWLYQRARPKFQKSGGLFGED